MSAALEAVGREWVRVVERAEFARVRRLLAKDVFVSGRHVRGQSAAMAGTGTAA